jgi:cholinesterase
MFKKTLTQAFTIASISSMIFLLVGIHNVNAASFNSFSRIYAFGDSYSDNGASRRISTEAVKAGVDSAFILPPLAQVYDPNGRWTNPGELVSVEVLAKKENLQLKNYAVGGAKSGNGNLSSWLDPYKNTGLFGQIDEYKTELKGAADTKGLHFIFISTVDLLEKYFFNQPGSVEQLASKGVDNIIEGISKLASIGAKQFFVVNSTDLSILPLFINNSADATKFTDIINQRLPNELSKLEAKLGLKIALYDHVAISNKIRANPTQYGFTNVNDACQSVYIPSGNSSICSNPDNYYFWDEIHPTGRTHEIIGKDMAAYLDTQKATPVTESSTVVALITTVGFMGFRKRHTTRRKVNEAVTITRGAFCIFKNRNRYD